MLPSRVGQSSFHPVTYPSNPYMGSALQVGLRRWHGHDHDPIQERVKALEVGVPMKRRRHCLPIMPEPTVGQARLPIE
jgi:hypothetical protein